MPIMNVREESRAHLCPLDVGRDEVELCGVGEVRADDDVDAARVEQTAALLRLELVRDAAVARPHADTHLMHERHVDRLALLRARAR